MKKILLLVLLALVSISVSARKSYITVYSINEWGAAYSYNEGTQLTGDVPDDIEGFEYDSDHHYWYNNCKIGIYSTGEILNLLSEYGYEVEFVDNVFKSFLLSKEIPSSQTEIEGDVNKDSEVNVADVNQLVDIILGLAKSNPSIMKQLKEQLK